MKKNIFKSNGFQSLLASLLCIVLGLFLGYLVLLVINPAGAGEAAKDFRMHIAVESARRAFIEAVKLAGGDL